MVWKWCVGLVGAVGLLAAASPKSSTTPAKLSPRKQATTRAATKVQNAPKTSAPRLNAAKAGALQAILIKGGEVWTATGTILSTGDVLIQGKKIVAVGANIKAPKGARVILAKGKVVTPALIDSHSHMGVYASPHVRATSDGNEASRPVTAGVWAEHSFWPQDPAIPRAVAGGTTVAMILPGSANLIGGRAVTLKLQVRRSVEEMKFPNAPHGLKMACGENPKRVHRGIQTRMGSYAGYRKAFLKAKRYIRGWKRYEDAQRNWKKQKAKAASCKIAKASKAPASQPSKGKKAKKKAACKPFTKPAPNPPPVDLDMETLKKVLAGKILVHIHCYRADEMLWMIKLSKEFGFKIRSFHHAVEAYKIRDILAREKISVSTWADWWGFKLEAFDGIQENAAMSSAAGVRVIIHSDSSIGIQRLQHEAAKAYYRGRAMGLRLSYDDVIRWITINPAWALGIDKVTGSLEKGKMADVVIWDGHPLKVRTRTHMVFMDGRLVFHRYNPQLQTDFELGLQQQQ
ncbi:MAG: amidohydrolase [Deltaproteobacteria bacterium]|nr:MAG: amidohydrolase [Deltaproteobacteria bacterium]